MNLQTNDLNEIKTVTKLVDTPYNRPEREYIKANSINSVRIVTIAI
ncbi:hypothetical protein N7453_006287 [Penicillium expansum]|nr:hypothetical protein N7453_006287 [Penicillium expansum]